MILIVFLVEIIKKDIVINVKLVIDFIMEYVVNVKIKIV